MAGTQTLWDTQPYSAVCAAEESMMATRTQKLACSPCLSCWRFVLLLLLQAAFYSECLLPFLEVAGTQTM